MYTMQSYDVGDVLWKASSIFCEVIKLLTEENKKWKKTDEHFQRTLLDSVSNYNYLMAELATLDRERKTR